MSYAIPSRLSDRELEATVARLASSEREATASLIAHLAELYARRLHERAGFSSLFIYCLEVLHLSEHEAYDRMKAAKVVRRYPAVLRLLASGQVNLTTIRLLAPHLTRENQEELFAAARGKRKRQVQELLAERFPQPDVAFSVRKLPACVGAAPAAAAAPVVRVESPIVDGPEATLSASEVPAHPSIPPPPRPLVQPLAPNRYQVTFTASTETREMLELAQDLLRHAIPSGDPAQIVARALSLLVEDLVRRKFAVTEKPRSPRSGPGAARHIPAHVKRAVYLRDRGRCAFVGAEGRRCGERAFLEFDHHPVPFAAGGKAIVENLELRCRAHNAYGAEQFFGKRWTTTGGRGAEHGRVGSDTISCRNEKAQPRVNDWPLSAGEGPSAQAATRGRRAAPPPASCAASRSSTESRRTPSPPPASPSGP